MTLPPSLDGRRVGVVGLGRAQRALTLRLLDEGAAVRVYDRDPRAVVPQGVTGATGPQYLEALARERPDVVFLTPGMRKDLEPLRQLRGQGVVISSEAPYFLERTKTPVLGITGSAGKTTTTTLVGEMLRRAGVPVDVGGNIGRPFCDLLPGEGRARWCVGEFSSFQLELAERSPQIAAILNIRPNHLDIHPSFEAYREAKWRIARFQTTADTLVLGADVALARGHGLGRVLRFALRPPADAFLADGRLRVLGEDMVDAAALRLPGAHNLLNALAAALLARLAGADREAVAAVLREFTGVEHRLQPVVEHAGVRYVNDSIATAPDRAAAAFAALAGPFVWLAGGYDKQLDYEPLLPALHDVRVACLFGPVGVKLLALLQRSGIDARLCSDFASAVRQACDAACPGDTVLLSPAAASYDEFANFEQRGGRFAELVRAWVGEH